MFKANRTSPAMPDEPERPLDRASLLAEPQPRRAARKSMPTSADFPGCRRRPMTYKEFSVTDSRVEYWDSRDGGFAWICADTSKEHERPSHRLAMLMHRIALARGANIECYGTMDLCELGPDGRNQRVLEADQSIYLDVKRANILFSPYMVLGRHAPPDIVLEVDNTTDARRKKLGIYESWGFPEVWIEVPDTPAASRPKSRKSATTIYAMQDGGYRESPASVAFPGWTAGEIHLALNERDISVRTYAALDRVGLALGRQEGTGPEHDPFMRSIMLRSRAEGREEGREEGRVRAVAETVRQILSHRGFSCSTSTLTSSQEFVGADQAELVNLALACNGEADLLAALAKKAGR